MYNEKDLIEQCQKGNTEAFGKLYDQHVRTIYNFIFYKTHHKETAEDITSQTFFKALHHIDRVDTSRSFISWLYKIAHNSVLDHYRTKKSHDDIEEAYDLSDTGGEEIIEALDSAEASEKVKAYLKHLNALEREIIIMRLWQDLSYKEIADTIGKSEASCKMMYSRTLKKLREIHEKDN